ncbi:MAG: penicillin-binding protein activator [Pseudomonadota bacterium]
MTSLSASRFKRLAPSLFFAAFLSVAGCTTTSPGPVGPISSGKPRVDPSNDTGPLDPSTDVVEEDLGELEDEYSAPVDYTPPHLADRDDLVRAGVMLPFSDRRASVRTQTEGMLAAIELALFDSVGDNFIILPKDTRGSQATAAQVAEELVVNGADIVLGPLFGANIPAVRDITAYEGIPIVSFSNDSSVAGGGAWLASIAPEVEVAEIIKYAALQGYEDFAFFGPQSALGQKVERAMQIEVAQNGGRMIASGFYPSDSVNPNFEAEYFAGSVAAAAETGRRVAVLVPERGNRLRRIAPLLAYHGVDTRVVRMLGISGWNDPSVWREPSLNGAWFTAPPQLEMNDFSSRYARQYGQEPTSLAALAYDAAALAMALGRDGDLTMEELTNPDGFAGVNGLFRFRSDGTLERSLAIMEIDPRDETGVREVRPVAASFIEQVG